MAKGTTFGTVHSNRDLGLIQQKVDIQPAQPKLNLIDIPGADGSKDLSDRPAGRIVYHDRVLTWTFALYPGDNWHDKHRQVSAALNGKRLDIILDDDPNYFYTGRLTVKKYNTDKVLRQITVEATCSPYMMSANFSSVSVGFPPNSAATYYLTVDAPTECFVDLPYPGYIEFKNYGISAPAGRHKLPIPLTPGENRITITLNASGVSNYPTVKFEYREGKL